MRDLLAFFRKPRFPKCQDCGHRFDARDPRAHVSTARDGTKYRTCPACQQLDTLFPEWSVWNDCNGVFETHTRRQDAVNALEAHYADCDARVIPVAVIPLPEDRHDFAEWNERELTRNRKNQDDTVVF